MTPDFLDREKPLTKKELAAERAKIVEMYRERMGTIEKFTCDDCGARYTCGLVFDAYNTNGDCLAEK